MPKHDGHTLNRKCVDCGAPVTKQATKCRVCSRIDRLKRLAAVPRLKLALLATHKICGRCKQNLLTSEFYIHKRGYYQTVCKSCNKIVHAEYVQNNRDEYNAREIEWRHRTGRSKMFGQGAKPKLNRPTKLGGKIYPSNWNERKKIIYARDNWTCQECNTKCHRKGEIQCHHIDYNTGNNLSINLITLCRACHAKTNRKRQIYQEYYEKKMMQIIER